MTTKPGAIITCLYKRTPELTFDLDYFRAVHVPLARKYWDSRGLIKAYWAIPTDESEFAFVLTMYWTSLEAWQEAGKVTEEMEGIAADVPKFTNGKATFVAGKVL
jgi:uncharacterized protein (TIGR02118 family)